MRECKFLIHTQRDMSSGVTARAIQVSIYQVLVGIALGGAIEGLLPKASETASTSVLTLELLVQAGMNGAALAISAPYLAQNDPTAGIPFSMGLLEAQPELRRRIGVLAAKVRGQVAQGALRMEAQVPML